MLGMMMHHIDNPKKSNKVSIEALYERYAPNILLYLRQHAITKEDAEDLLVEVFLAAMESTTLLALPEDTQLAWLQRVARNKAIDHVRRSTRRQAVNLDDLTEILPDDEQLAPERVAVQHEDRALLRKRLTSLPLQQQEVLRLRFNYGLRSREIAQHLNKSDTAVRMLLSRAIGFLRTIYRQQEGGNSHE
jgi:RNA polymerase sigma-70 factor (ECF subfamily)